MRTQNGTASPMRTQTAVHMRTQTAGPIRTQTACPMRTQTAGLCDGAARGEFGASVVLLGRCLTWTLTNVFPVLKPAVTGQGGEEVSTLQQVCGEEL